MFIREAEAGDLSRGKAVESGMGTNEVEEEDEHGNEVIRGCLKNERICVISTKQV